MTGKSLRDSWKCILNCAVCSTRTHNQHNQVTFKQKPHYLKRPWRKIFWALPMDSTQNTGPWSKTKKLRKKLECGLKRMRRRIREQKFEGMNKGELSHTQPTKPSQSLSSLSLSSSLPSLIIVVNHHCHHHYLHHHRHGDWKTQMLRNSASMFSDHAMLNLRSPPAPFSLIQKMDFRFEISRAGRSEWMHFFEINQM